MTNSKITADALWSYVETYRRVTGRAPRLRERVEHFDGKLLNVLMCLTELPKDRADAIRLAVKADRQAQASRRLAK